MIQLLNLNGKFKKRLVANVSINHENIIIWFVIYNPGINDMSNGSKNVLWDFLSEKPTEVYLKLVH